MTWPNNYHALQSKRFVNTHFLKSIHCVLYESHINYACITWEQSISRINWFYILQKKALLESIFNFKGHNAHPSPVFHYSKIIIYADIDKNENCLFLKNKLPSIFTNWFTFSSMSHNYQTSYASKEIFKSPESKHYHVEKMLLSMWL